MQITTELLLNAIPALEEVDKAMSTAASADQIMIGQTDILFTMGFQDKSLMQAGFNAYNTALGGFKTDMLGIVSGFQKGTYTYTQAMDRWDSITKDHYIKMFSAGTKAIGNPFYEKMGLTKKDLTFINGAKRLERRFMSKLLMDIENPKHVPKFRFPKGHPYAKLPPYLQRGLAYAESGKAQFMNGMLAGAGSRMDIYWVLGVPQLEHCDVCPVYASRKWTWQSLPTVPRAGGTPCLFRCYCILEFKPKTTARGFDLAGKATEGALRAPGKQGRVFDSAGREMGGELQARVEDAYARMYKARQMMLATKGEARMEWVRARIAANREIIEITAAGKYRTVPTVSVRALAETMKSAIAKGGTLIDDFAALMAGDEIVFVSGDFSGVGVIAVRGNRLVFRSPSGLEMAIENETDVVFLLGRKLQAPKTILKGRVSSDVTRTVEGAVALVPKEQQNALVNINVADRQKFLAAGGDSMKDAAGYFSPRLKQIWLDEQYLTADIVLHEIGHNIDATKAFLPRKRFAIKLETAWYSKDSFWKKLYKKAKGGKAKYFRSYSLRNTEEYFADCYMCWVSGKFGFARTFRLNLIPKEAVAWFERKYGMQKVALSQKYGGT